MTSIEKQLQIRSNALKSYENIEKEFFDIDEENRLAKICLCFDRVSDVFDVNYIVKKPVLSDDFMDWIASTFTLIPSRYRIGLSVSFNDYEGYTEEQLNDIFWKNIVLDAKCKLGHLRKRKSIAYGLIAAGILFFIGMILTETLWETESVMKTIFSYVSDIATTVAFWEAMTILIVERKESRSHLMTVEKRFSGVSFKKQ